MALRRTKSLSRWFAPLAVTITLSACSPEPVAEGNLMGNEATLLDNEANILEGRADNMVAAAEAITTGDNVEGNTDSVVSDGDVR